MRHRFIVACGLIAFVAALGTFPGLSDAAFIVAPNSASGTAGGTLEYAPFGNDSNSAFTFQFEFAASQFSSLPSGSAITSLGFRLGSGISTLATETDFPEFNIQIGKSTEPVGSLSTTFATNLGSDTVLARSGPLVIPGGSFVGGSTVNPFYQIAFTTPYAYTGGDLLITIRDTFSSTNYIGVDAVVIGGTNDTNSADSDSATTGRTHFFNAPVIQLGYGAVPEPSSLTLLGVGALATQLRRRVRASR